MANRSDITRWTNYKARYNDNSQPALALLTKDQAFTLQRNVFHYQVGDEIRVSQIHAESGESAITSMFYQAFARQIRKAMQNNQRGTALLAKVDVILNNWVGRGLVRETCEKIRNDVFTLAAPAP